MANDANVELTNLGNAPPNPDPGHVTQPPSRVSTGLVQDRSNDPEGNAGLSSTQGRSESYESILSIIARIFRGQKPSLNPDAFEVYLRGEGKARMMADVYRLISSEPAASLQSVFSFMTLSLADGKSSYPPESTL
jgi:hypothetical protein